MSESKGHYQEQQPYYEVPFQQPRIMEKRGVTVTPGDPEYSKHIEPLLKQGPNLYEDDLALATERAVEDKKAR